MSPPDPDAVLATKAVQGAVWSLTTTLSVRLVSLLSLAILARLLAPEQFGLMALGLVFLTYVETVGDLGTGAALIYWPDRRREVAQLTFWISLLTGLLWFGASQLGAPLLARFFHAPEAEPLLRVLALSFPLRALGRAHDSLCQKDLRFKARMLPESAMFLTKGAVAITLALSGSGVWSLVWGQLAGEALRTISLWIVVPWRPSLAIPHDLASPILRYGSGIIAVNLLAAVLHHADLVIVGRRLGAEALGLYQIAGKVPEITIALLVWGGAKVLFPTLSRVQQTRARLRRFYLEALRWIAVLALPATVGLFLLAEPLLLSFFGEAWIAAVPILRALAVYTGLRALGSHSGDVLKATGRSRLLAGLGVVKALLLLPVLVWASSVGAPAVAWGLTAVSAVGLILNLGFVFRILDLRWTDLLDSLRTSLPGTLATLLALSLWTHLSTGLSPVVTLVGGVGLGLSLCLLALRWRSPGHFQEAFDQLFRPPTFPTAEISKHGVLKAEAP